MKKFAVETIGCRLNQYETERIADQLTQLGLERVAYDEPADLYVINTCTVTGRADASCRNIISRAARRKGDAAVVVVGCYVDSEPDKVAHLTGVDLVVNNSGKADITEVLRDNFPSLIESDRQSPGSSLLGGFYQHNRAWIKIGDGCNQHCAYCIIPQVRGRLVNRPAEEIIDEINLLYFNGYREVVLTGVHIGQYAHNDIESIAQLIKYILNRTDISRLRLSSIEPQEVNSALIDVMIEGGRRVCRHLHVPLQSGSDRILKIMRRPYKVGKYLENLRTVKNNIGGVTIGADIIVGFPGETEDDFAQSVKAAESGLIDYLHVFSYSDRPGTDASGMAGKIDPEIIKKRNKILREISDKNYAAALKREVGQTVYAISEYGTDNSGKYYWGITDNYLKVVLPEYCGGGKEIIKLDVTLAGEKYLEGIN